jgi:hypothetical protein
MLGINHFLPLTDNSQALSPTHSFLVSSAQP